MLDEEFAQRHSRICGSFLNESSPYSFSRYKKVCPRLSTLQRMVVGTGGGPVLFKQEDEMKSYFEQVKGRYAHIVNGILPVGESEVLMDFRCAPMEGLTNYRFQCYYHIMDNTIRNRYQDKQCFSPPLRRFLSPTMDTDLTRFGPYTFYTFWMLVDYLHMYDIYRVILSIFFFGHSSDKKRISVLLKHLGKKSKRINVLRSKKSKRNEKKRKSLLFSKKWVPKRLKNGIVRAFR